MKQAIPRNIIDEEDTSLSGQDRVPLCIPHIDGRVWEYVKECLDTGWVSSVGSFVDRFERAIAEYIGARHTIATVNGTAALHVALRVAGVRRDDEVLVSALSFIAPANAIRYLGAWPVFIDAEPDYWQMSPKCVSEFVDTQCRFSNGELRNLRTGRRVSAILPVHILGHPVDMDPILAVADKYSLVVIEDATEGLGARYKGKMVGCLGDIGCLSFNGNKLITTGGGGMIVTHKPEWAAHARHLTTQAKTNPVEFVHDEVGYNYRLSNLQAALGCAQVELLSKHIEAKTSIATRYCRAIASLPGLTPMPSASWGESVYWMYTILVDEAVCGLSSRKLMKIMKTAGIETRPLWQPLHHSPAHADAGWFDCPVADRLNDMALSLPCSVGLTEREQNRVIDVLRTSQASDQ